MFYDDDADLHMLDGKTVAIIGYGSQGHAHALNLKDSGVAVVVGLRPARRAASRRRREHGLRVVEPADAASEGDVVMMLVPDELHRPGVGSRASGTGSRPATCCCSATASRSTTAGRAAAGRRRRARRAEGPRPPRPPPVPRGLGRARAGRGRSRTPPATRSALALAYAKGIGCTRGGVIETTFKDETETDLFGEQAVLCGGVTELVRAGYETLVDAGYDPRLAYFECLHELKLIVDLMYEKGIAGMRYSISNTAEYGDLTRGKRVIGPESRAAMKQLLARDPVRRLRARVDRREPRRAGELQAHARRAGRPPGRGRRELAQMDWIDTEFADRTVIDLPTEHVHARPRTYDGPGRRGAPQYTRTQPS